MSHTSTLVATLLGLALVSVPASTQAPQPPPASQQQQQPSEIELSITGQPGTPPKYAVPDFLALTADAETVAAAKTIGQVVWDDLAFEREFYLIPRDTYASIPIARSLDRRAVRSVERARRRRPGVGHGAEDGGRHPRGGPAVQRAFAAAGVRARVQRLGQQPPLLRAHDRRRDPPAAARAPRRGADQAHLLLRSRSRAGRRHGREPRGEGGLHRRLRRRQPAAGHGEPHAEHHADLVAGRARDCLHVLQPRVPRRLRVAHLRGLAPEADRRQDAELAAGMVARRIADCVHVEP